MENVNELRVGFEAAYVDGSVASSLTYRPQFVSNNYKEGKKVLQIGLSRRKKLLTE